MFQLWNQDETFWFMSRLRRLWINQRLQLKN
jgi:hypothetical protein